jgi:hypothetical protein
MKVKNGLTSFALSLSVLSSYAEEKWMIASQKDWADNLSTRQGMVLKDGTVSPVKKQGSLQTKVKN